MNISNFMTWFIQQFVNIGRQMIGKLDEIIIYNGVSLLDFIVTITIINMFIAIILTIPQNMNRISRREERKQKNDKESK